MIKDSGARAEFEGGMVRDVTEGKVDYTLVFDGPMFERWAVHLTDGAQKYAKRNWMKGYGNEEVADRFKESALRHFVQWFRGDTDEDHAAAVFFNINGFEYVKEGLVQPEVDPTITITVSDPNGSGQLFGTGGTGVYPESWLPDDDDAIISYPEHRYINEEEGLNGD